MSYKKDNLRRARLALDERAAAARALSDARMKELRDKYPQIREIDAVISSTGVRLMEAAKLGANGYDERVAQIRDENALLLEKRAAFLCKMGYPADYDAVRYSCPLCEDTGFVGGKMCACLEKLLREEAIADSGLSGLLGEETFENFLCEYYPDKAAAARVRDTLKAFAGAPAGNIFLFGATGLGKTHLSSAVAQTALEAGYYVIYETAQNIFSDYEDVRFRSGERAKTECLFDCDLLIIDDLGCEFRNQFTSYALYEVINTRINAKKPMLISSNLRGQSIADAYGDRIFSRIAGEFTLLSLEGKDIRMQKKMK